MEKMILRFLENHAFEYESNANMAEKTWIHRGPIVPFLVIPHTIIQLEEIISFLLEINATYKIIGHTSNLYFKNTFSTDVLISTRKLTSYHEENGMIVCDTGVNVSRLSYYAVEKGYEGFEGLVGLPGTLGAALVNNSSCFNCAVSDLVEELEVLVIEDNHPVIIRILDKATMSFQHRSSAIKRGELHAIILRVKLKINPVEDAANLKLIAQKNVELRRETQEGKSQNLGSIFSGVHPKPIHLMSFGWTKIGSVILYRIREHFCRHKSTYRLRRNGYLLRLYGYRDIEKYVSPKNINCFVWKDSEADRAFDRYCDFMHKYAKCEAMEIEVLS